MNIDLLIFSKDRPSQLEFLLRSIQLNTSENWNIGVLVKTTNKYKNGYDVTRSLFPEVKFIEESHFRENMIEFFKNGFYTNACIICDDCVFYRKTPALDLDIELGYVFSQRMGLNSKIQNPHNGQPLVVLNNYVESDKYIFWNPHDYNNLSNWGYPFANDGNIYNRKQFLDLIQRFEWHNSNQLEGGLQQFRNEIVMMICRKTSSLICTLWNNVSTMTQIGHINFTCEYMNEMFLSGKRLSLDMFKEIDVIGAHQNIPIQWEE